MLGKAVLRRGRYLRSRPKGEIIEELKPMITGATAWKSKAKGVGPNLRGRVR